MFSKIARFEMLPQEQYWHDTYYNVWFEGRENKSPSNVDETRFLILQIEDKIAREVDPKYFPLLSTYRDLVSSEGYGHGIESTESE